GHATGDDRAIKAAEKAIANPLLEDISVAGARGLLVNITSGLDFTPGEFNDVGDVLDQVAAQDARVIIGTSVDEAMTDEIRVTVVATGLETEEAGNAKPEVVKPNLQAVKANNQEAKMSEPEVQQAAASAQPAQTTIDMAQPEILAPEPEVVRPKMVVNGAAAGSMESSNYLDIPAFLRRQAD
ncbi:MAG TPA: cell division protein FtsZ, partial [Thiomicrospira sp.]|nr:cell division protein FtsZ [Thiomicrospira sp.]